jgi:hypothetical protein
MKRIAAEKVNPTDPLGKYTKERRSAASKGAWNRRTPETKAAMFEKIGRANTGRKASAETREKLRISHLGQVAWNKGRKETRPEVLQRFSESHKKAIKELLNSPKADEYRKNLSKARKKEWADPEIAARRTNRLQKIWDNEEYRKKHRIRMQQIASDPNWKGRMSRKKSEEEKQKIIRAVKARWQDPEYKERVSKKIQAVKCLPENRKKTSKQTLARWNDPAQREQLLNGARSMISMAKPNNTEKAILAMLDEIQPELWVFTGGGRHAKRVAGHYPDFLSETQGKIVELDGSYWHKNIDKDHKRNTAYIKAGYRLLTILYSKPSDLRTIRPTLEEFCHA